MRSQPRSRITGESHARSIHSLYTFELFALSIELTCEKHHLFLQGTQGTEISTAGCFWSTHDSVRAQQLCKKLSTHHWLNFTSMYPKEIDVDVFLINSQSWYNEKSTPLQVQASFMRSMLSYTVHN